MKLTLTIFILVVGLAAGAILFYAQNREVALHMSHSAPVLVDTTEDDSALGFPDSRKLAVDSQGNLYVAYRKRFKLIKTTRFHVFVAKSTDGGATWRVANGGRPVEEVGDFVQRVPSIAVDANDVIHVVWYGTDAQFSGVNERQVKYVQSADGGASWSAWRNMAPVLGYEDDALWQEHPTIHIDPQDHLHVAWQGRDAEHGQKSQIKWSRSTDGGDTWSAWRNISADASRSFSRPVLIFGTEGRLYALAYADGQEGMRIFWTHSDNGGVTWQEWAMVAPGQRDQRHFSAAVDQQGRIHLAWRQRAGAEDAPGATLVHYTRFDGDAWRKPVPVAPMRAPDTQLYQFFPTLTVDAQAHIWLAWLETPDPSGYLQEKPITGAVQYVAGAQSGWRTPQTLAQGVALYPSFIYGNHRYLPLASPLLVWEERRSDAETKILFTSLSLQP